MNERDRLTRASKQISWLLRHGAATAGVAIDAAGWADVDDVLAALEMPRATLEAVVRENSKSRFELDGGRVRASQGHSRDVAGVSLDALEASWQRFDEDQAVYHGTRIDALGAIAREGILPIGRTHVHLAASPTSPVGKRAEVDVLLVIAPPKVRAAGVALFRSPNGVLLARHIPTSSIVNLVAVSAAAKRDVTTLRSVFALPTGEL